MALNNIDQLFNNIPDEYQIVNDIIDIKKQKRNESLYKYNHSDKGKMRNYKFKLFYF